MGYRHTVPAARDDGTWPIEAFVVTSGLVQQPRDEIPTPTHSAGDASPGLFAPDILLGTQQAGGGPPDTASRRLLGAVLERALLDAAGPTAREAERGDALAWFHAEDESPFSFRWIAFHLGLEPAWILVRLDSARRRLGGDRPRDAAGQPPTTEPSRAGDPDAKTRRAA